MYRNILASVAPDKIRPYNKTFTCNESVCVGYYSIIDTIIYLILVRGYKYGTSNCAIS